MRTLFTRAGMALLAVVLLVNAAPAAVGVSTAPQVYTVIQPKDVKWGPAPDAFPAGAQLAVLDGDPFSDGYFTVRMKMPAGYRIPPHWHPTAEMVTVLEGSVHMGQGADYEEGRAQQLGPGGFNAIAAQEDHYLWADEHGATVQVSGKGPFEINYVNPSDDPRKPDEPPLKPQG